MTTIAVALLIIYAIGVPVVTGIVHDDGDDIDGSLFFGFIWPGIVFVALPFYGLWKLGQWIRSI